MFSVSISFSMTPLEFDFIESKPCINLFHINAVLCSCIVLMLQSLYIALDTFLVNVLF